MAPKASPRPSGRTTPSSPRPSSPRPSSSSWLGRAKHVTINGPGRWRATVGEPTELLIDLSQARPNRSDLPPSVLIVSVLDSGGRVTWSAEHEVPCDAESRLVALGPMRVAGAMSLSVTLDSAHVRSSPLPLRVAPGPPFGTSCELSGGATGTHVVAKAGDPSGFFMCVLRHASRAPPTPPSQPRAQRNRHRPAPTHVAAHSLGMGGRRSRSPG